MPTAYVKPAGSSVGFAPETLGGGALVQFRMTPGALFEWGALYVKRGYQGVASTVTMPFLEFPALLRFYVLPSATIGFGGYYGYNLSGGNYDLGGVGSFAIRIDIAPFIALVGDARYVLGLRNLSTTGVTTLNEFQGLTGIRFGL